MLLIENKIVVLRDGETEIGFPSVDELGRHLPEVNISRCYDYRYLDYEPERKMHFYSLKSDALDASLAKGPIPDPELDRIVENSALAKQRSQDPYYGKSLNEAKNIAKSLVTMKTLAAINEIAPEIDRWRIETGLLDKQSRNESIRALIVKHDETVTRIESALSISDVRDQEGGI
jgi:hypothetical protein